MYTDLTCFSVTPRELSIVKEKLKSPPYPRKKTCYDTIKEMIPEYLFDKNILFWSAGL